MELQAQIINLRSDCVGKNGEETPGHKVTCKFVIISTPTDVRLIYGPVTEYSYHAALVKHFCDTNNIPSGWVKTPDVYEIYDSGYSVRGGGWLDINEEEETATFYGQSTAYGGFDADELTQITGSLAASFKYRIMI